MRTSLPSTRANTVLICLFFHGVCAAQFQNPGGLGFWNTPAPPATNGVAIGALPGPFNATFQIRADQIPVTANTPQAQQNRIFETWGDATNPSFWRMWRGNDPLGRIFCNGAATNLGFNIQQTRFQGSLNLMNRC
ncbi:MAG: hypothetical protein IPJ76_00210 [Flavobacteriales bacterium]|nr:MAG: hypothetical protein IPJ76_00210 [Flavobacteriales bacterium]